MIYLDTILYVVDSSDKEQLVLENAPNLVLYDNTLIIRAVIYLSIC